MQVPCGICQAPHERGEPCGYCGTPDVFCPFSGSGLCPGGCPDNNHRACVDGEDDG